MQMQKNAMLLPFSRLHNVKMVSIASVAVYEPLAYAAVSIL